MIVFGLIVTIFFGVCLALSISKRLKLLEVLGLAFPLGIAAQTFLMVCLDWIGIKITAWSVIISTFIIMGALLVYLFLCRKQLREFLNDNIKFKYPTLSWAWFIGFAAIGVVVVMNVAKTMYFPTFDTDSVRGFNLVGKVVANEGTIKFLSIFTGESYRSMMSAPGSYMTYTPLTQLAYAYVYMLGAETSKIINALMFISFVFAFYGVLRRFATPLGTIITTFFVIITPEMLAFSSLSGTNFIHAIYASLGIIFLIAWYYKKENSLLWVSAALLMCNSWTRNEGLAFIGAACLILLYYSIRNKQYKQLFIYGVLCLFPFVFWNIFLKINHLEATNVIIFKPHYDEAKLSIILNEMWILFKSTTFYGITFILFLLVLISNVWNIYKKRDNAVALLLIILSWLIYTILVYQVDYLWDTVERVMRYSYKRFLFSFVPLLWFYIAINKNISWLFAKIDDFVFPKKKNTK